MTTFVRCGQLFTGRENAARRDCTLVVGDDGLISYAGPTAGARTSRSPRWRPARGVPTCCRSAG